MKLLFIITYISLYNECYWLLRLLNFGSQTSIGSTPPTLRL